MYNFDEIIDRTNTNSVKWQEESIKFQFGRGDLLPFWIADMDFKVADPILDAVVERAKHGIYGYTLRTESYFNSIRDWTKRRFNWDIDSRWIVYTPGIVPAISYIIQTFTRPGESVLIQEPVYYPFKDIVESNGRKIVSNDLIYKNGHYSIDFEDFEKKIKEEKVGVFILCSPHNPVGRVWTRDELIRMADICLENKVLIIADEIHNDIVYKPSVHHILASLKKEYEDITITCTAPSKTFNLASMEASNIIIPNEKYREDYRVFLEKNSINLQNPMSIVAVEAAYNEGEEWLEDLLIYLQGNILTIKEFLERQLPKARMADIQGTYLGWIDLSEYESDGEKLEKAMVEVARVAFDGGTWFGQGGNGFIRLNFACPRALLVEGLNRMKEAVDSLK